MRRVIDDSVSGSMFDMQADYRAGKRDRFLRRRTRLGGSGDAHYTSTAEFAQIREYVRDMDRNDSMVGSLVDRAVTNQLQSGFRPKPDTGDEGLNTGLIEEFNEWGENPEDCDYHRERTLWELAWYVLRSTYIDGDMVVPLIDDGSLQLVESDRLVSPKTTPPNRTVIHGVELMGRIKTGYFFARDAGAKRHTKGEPYRVDAMDADGFKQVLHVANPHTIKRVTQTRGVSAFAPVFHRMTMYEDEHFAYLVGRQVSSAVALFISRDANYKGGATSFGHRTSETLTQDDGTSNTRLLEKLTPGMVVRGARGEKAELLSPNLPSADVVNHLRMILMEIGVTIGVPLILALMDASETNFSGWRGAYEEAKKAWRVNQRWFVSRFLRPVYVWKLRQWIADGTLGPAARNNRRLFKHTWGLPHWPYTIQPMVDAQANGIKLSTGQMTPSGYWRENGDEWTRVARELVADWGFAINEAKTLATKINETHDDGNPVHWRDVLNLVVPKGMTLSGPIAQSETDSPKETSNAF